MLREYYNRKLQWTAQLPVYAPAEIPFLVDVLTENIIYAGGDISTAQWECTSEWFDYGAHRLVVTYYRQH